MKETEKSSLIGTTPFPNILLDTVMPVLKDSQWRLLCVIVRQTLGWHDSQTGERKQWDWLSQSQLKTRTGRNTQALALAIDALVQQGYIAVQDESGNRLNTPNQRRAHRGRSYYGLSDLWRHRIGISVCETSRYSPVRKRQTKTTQIRTNQMQSAQDIFSTQIKYDTARKPYTTKETQTKETLLEIPMSLPPVSSAAEMVPEVREFITQFEETGRRLVSRLPATALPPADIIRLEKLLASPSYQRREKIIDSFFRSDMNYIRRREYSLRAFLETCHILALRQKKS